MLAFETIRSDPEEENPIELTEQDLEDLTMQLTEVEELIVDPEFYAMTRVLIRSFRYMF